MECHLASAALKLVTWSRGFKNYRNILLIIVEASPFLVQRR